MYDQSKRLHGFVRIKSTGEVKVCLTTTANKAKDRLIHTYQDDAYEYGAQGLEIEMTESPAKLLPYNSKDMIKAILTVKTEIGDITITYQQLDDIIPPDCFHSDNVFSPKSVYPAAWELILATTDHMPNKQTKSDTLPPDEPDKIYTVIRPKTLCKTCAVKAFKTQESAIAYIEQDRNNAIENNFVRNKDIEFMKSHDNDCTTLTIWDGYELKTYEWRLFATELSA